MRMMVFLFALLVCWGCAPAGEEYPGGSLSVGVSGEGWPDAVSPTAARLVLALGDGYVQGGTVMIEDAAGGRTFPAAVWDTGSHGFRVTLGTLPERTRCTLVLSNLAGSDSAMHVFTTNFSTGTAAVPAPPAVTACWPAPGAEGVPTAGTELKLVFSREVVRRYLTLCLYGAGTYHYMQADGSGSGTSATFTLSGQLAPATLYQALVGGVRGTDGSCGTGKLFHFRTASAAATNTPPPVLFFSELCWQLTADNPAGEFIELYNPTPYPFDLAAAGVRLYRNTGSGWTLVCDFANPAHFAAAPAVRIAGFGYCLIANQQAGFAADALVIPSRLTMTGNEAFALSRGGTPGEGRTLDMVSFIDAVAEGGPPVARPASGQSCERKACRDATTQDMGPSGIYRMRGNGWRSGSPAADFLPRQYPEPQGTGTGLEIPW